MANLWKAKPEEQFGYKLVELKTKRIVSFSTEAWMITRRIKEIPPSQYYRFEVQLPNCERTLESFLAGE